MIHPSELRIGNYILVEAAPDLPRPHKVQAKDIYDLAMGKITLAAIEPILLSPQILEAAGFVNNGQGIFDHPTWHSFVYPRNDAYLVSHVTGVAVKYLHQLQNLYFALTGQELTVSLPLNK